MVRCVDVGPEGRADLVLGSRLLDPDGAIAGGMPRWKYAANRFLTIIENRVLGTDLAPNLGLLRACPRVTVLATMTLLQRRHGRI